MCVIPRYVYVDHLLLVARNSFPPAKQGNLRLTVVRDKKRPVHPMCSLVVLSNMYTARGWIYVGFRKVVSYFSASVTLANA